MKTSVVAVIAAAALSAVVLASSAIGQQPGQATESLKSEAKKDVQTACVMMGGEGGMMREHSRGSK